MRNIVYLPAKDAGESVAFYVEALELFEVADDLGMDSILLRYRRSSDFFLMISPDDTPPREDGAPIFSVEIDDCVAEFSRLKQRLPEMSFSLQPSGPIEYPLGTFLKLRDPAGNAFVLYEWYL